MIHDLVLELKLKLNKEVDDYLFRISAHSDLARVKRFGSSRIGLSDKLWDKIDGYPKGSLPKYPIRHDEMIIASYWADMERDSYLINGTLKHKLSIYDAPFFTVYRKDGLLEVAKEISLGENNHGTHFFFLKNPKDCLDSLWAIIETESGYKVERLA